MDKRYSILSLLPSSTNERLLSNELISLFSPRDDWIVPITGITSKRFPSSVPKLSHLKFKSEAVNPKILIGSSELLIKDSINEGPTFLIKIDSSR